MTREEEIKEARHEWYLRTQDADFCAGFQKGAEWADSSAWKNVKDELPDFDREVVALQRMDSGSHKVIYAHRPNPKGYIFSNGGILYAKTYDNGFNLPDVEWWLDLDLPFNED